MPCLFCNSFTHATNNCTNPGVLSFKNEILNKIESRYFTYIGVGIDMTIVKSSVKQLLMVLTLNQLKLIVQHYKNIVRPREPTGATFRNFPTRKYDIICSLVEIIFNEIDFNQRNGHLMTTMTTITGRPIGDIIAPAPARTAPAQSRNDIMERAREFFFEVMPEERRQAGVLLQPAQAPPPKIYVRKTIRPCEGTECPICYEPMNNNNYVMLNCHHEFCKDCIKKTIKSTTCNKDCALCRCKITTMYTQKPVVKYSL
jgi:hypothetical protein